MDFDRLGDEHDEGARGSADLEAAAAERRDQKAADDRRIEPVLRLGARGDGDGHGERQRNYRDGEAGERVGFELRQPIALAHRGDELGREAVGEALRQAHGKVIRMEARIERFSSAGVKS